MLALLFTACTMLASGEECKLNKLTITQAENAMQCMIFAQASLSIWLEEHPGSRIQSWKCAKDFENL